MDKVVYPVGSKVRVTKTHTIVWEQATVQKGDVLTVKHYYPTPHAYGPKVAVYIAENETGDRVVVSEDRIEPIETFSKGDKVFVTETHTVKGEYYMKVYAGNHLTIDGFSPGFGDVPAHYCGVNVDNDDRFLLPDKVALVESEPEKLTPPVAPIYVGKQGEVVWGEKGSDLEGYWTYDNYWGWSNFVPSNANLYRQPVKGENMRTSGTLATSALDGSVQAV